jgi:hypothetical protein
MRPRSQTLNKLRPCYVKKIFIVDDDKQVIVGDDKQVSPMAAFIENAKVERLARGFLKYQSFKTLLLPGASLYDLAQVIPDSADDYTNQRRPRPRLRINQPSTRAHYPRNSDLMTFARSA